MKFLLYLIAVFLPLSSPMAETIRIISPYNAGHSATPALMKLVDQANSDQNIYRFQLEFRPGANQSLAVKALNENSLAVIAPAFVENVDSGQLNQTDYLPVLALGNACWAVVTNRPLSGGGEFTIGGVGVGNAAHITGIALGAKYGFKIRYVIFRSNNDALINMAGDHGVNLVIDKWEAYDSLRQKNHRMRMVAASCTRRLQQAPSVPTLAELGVHAPYIFNIIIANKDMPVARRLAIGKILESSILQIGPLELYRLSAMRPPIFDGVSTEHFYRSSIETTRDLATKYRSQIESAKTNH